MSKHELENLDLNRILALYWLLEDIQVTRAARHLGTSQPALSRTLKDLRDWFGDPLLVRRGREMVRSSFAENLRPRLARVVSELREIARPPGTFDAQSARAAVRIACTDYVAAMVLQAWQQGVAPRAPGLDLELRNLGAESGEELESGALELVIRPSRYRVGDNALARAPWFEDRYVTWVRRGHPLAGRRLDWKRFASVGHVQVGRGRSPSSEIDRVFRAQGVTRRIAVRVESFLLATQALAHGDYVATLPGLVARVGDVALAQVHTPLELDPFTLDLVWHPRHTLRDSHAFVREALLEWARPRRSARSRRDAARPTTRPRGSRAPGSTHARTSSGRSTYKRQALGGIRHAPPGTAGSQRSG